MQELKELLFKMYKAQCAQEIELFNRGVEEGAGDAIPDRTAREMDRRQMGAA